jgi:hypothetical protein
MARAFPSRASIRGRGQEKRGPATGIGRRAFSESTERDGSAASDDRRFTTTQALPSRAAIRGIGPGAAED